MNLKIKDILSCTNGKLIIGDEDKECTSYSKDTRTIKNGDTYIGIKGEKFDGSSFWEEAFNKGAETVIISDIAIDDEKRKKYSTQGKNIIVVENTIIALGKMAKYKRELYGKKIKVVGVTGSVGKTSTKDIIANVLAQKYKTLKTEGNNNNNIGLPLTILRIQDEEVAVIEMGMNHLGEISYLSNIAKPDISVITNVGTAHIGILGSRENILKAKLEILDGMDEKTIIINNDNDLLNRWQKENKGKIDIYTFGINNNSDFMAKEIIEKENSSDFICQNKEDSIKITVPVSGNHFVYNALCGVTCGKILNLSYEEITKGIKSFKLTAKRMEIVKLKNGVTLINDSYNASYESMKAALSNLKKMIGKRKIAVLGDMFELGAFAEELHRKVGKEVQKNEIDRLYAIGEKAKFIEEEAIKNGFRKEYIFYYKNKSDLYNELISSLKDGDVVLIKASNGMQLFEIAGKLQKELG